MKPKLEEFILFEVSAQRLPKEPLSWLMFFQTSQIKIACSSEQECPKRQNKKSGYILH